MLTQFCARKWKFRFLFSLKYFLLALSHWPYESEKPTRLCVKLLLCLWWVWYMLEKHSFADIYCIYRKFENLSVRYMGAMEGIHTSLKVGGVTAIFQFLLWILCTSSVPSRERNSLLQHIGRVQKFVWYFIRQRSTSLLSNSCFPKNWKKTGSKST